MTRLVIDQDAKKNMYFRASFVAYYSLILGGFICFPTEKTDERADGRMDGRKDKWKNGGKGEAACKKGSNPTGISARKA